MTEIATNCGRIRIFFSNPLVGGVGTLASVIGVLLGIYFFLESRRERDLTYCVHPVKSIVVRAGEVSDLSVSSHGTELKTDATTAQIALWNAGKESIRAEHVLRPFLIETEGNTPILEARIRKQSRDIVGLQLDQSRMAQGEVGVSWSILERGDGGVIQVIFAGDTDVRLSASAVIEGQPEVRSMAFAGQIRPAMEHYSDTIRTTRHAGYFLLVYGMALGALNILVFLRRKLPGRDGMPDRRWSVVVVSTFFVIGMGVFLLLMGRNLSPPFGF